MTPIHERNLPMPLETFDHASLLQLIAIWLKPEHYLELGVRHGETFYKMQRLCKKSTGVDIAPTIHQDNIIETTTDNYIASLTNERFDMVFIDAYHKKEQVIKDFLGIAPFVIEDGLVFLHDTYPCDERMCSPEYTEDCWEAALWIKQNCSNEWEILTLPFNPGLTILKKTPITRQLLWK